MMPDNQKIFPTFFFLHQLCCCWLCCGRNFMLDCYILMSLNFRILLEKENLGVSIKCFVWELGRCWLSQQAVTVMLNVWVVLLCWNLFTATCIRWLCRPCIPNLNDLFIIISGFILKTKEVRFSKYLQKSQQDNKIQNSTKQETRYVCWRRCCRRDHWVVRSRSQRWTVLVSPESSWYKKYACRIKFL